jgi:hypothetical protein
MQMVKSLTFQSAPAASVCEAKRRGRTAPKQNTIFFNKKQLQKLVLYLMTGD